MPPSATAVSDLALLGAGREAEIFEWAPGRVLRLARSPGDGDLIAREHLALTAARHAGAPVPEAFERVEVEGRPGLVMERLGKHDLLATSTGRPWRIGSVGHELGALHAAIHPVRAPDDLPDVRETLRLMLHSDLVPDDLRGPALRRLEGLPGGDRLLHGDLHPANLLRGGDGFLAIDWSGASRGDTMADVARTRLLLTQAALPAPPPLPVRPLIGLGRRILLSGYLRAYSGRAALDGDGLRRWGEVLTVARLAEGIPEERNALLAAARSQLG